MSGTDNIDEDVQMDRGEREVSFDAKPFQDPAYPSNNAPTSFVESNTHTRPGSSPSTAILSKGNRDDKYYNMKHKKRGKAILFNLEKFQQLDERKGSTKDMERLYQTFLKLGFEVISHGNDLDLNKLRNTLSDVAANTDSDCDCLVVVCMSHGSDGDRLWANDKCFHAKELWEPFFGDKCPALVGKPKLFFIQACGGKTLRTVKYVRDAVSTSNKTLYTLPNQSDILIAQATISGNSVARNSECGSWFIQSLCDELDENGKKESILSLLNSVNRRVAINYDIEENRSILKQQPIVMYTLTREILFTDK